MSADSWAYVTAERSGKTKATSSDGEISQNRLIRKNASSEMGSAKRDLSAQCSRPARLASIENIEATSVKYSTPHILERGESWLVTKIPKSNGVVVGFRWAEILKKKWTGADHHSTLPITSVSSSASLLFPASLAEPDSSSKKRSRSFLNHTGASVRRRGWTRLKLTNARSDDDGECVAD